MLYLDNLEDRTLAPKSSSTFFAVHRYKTILLSLMRNHRLYLCLVYFADISAKYTNFIENCGTVYLSGGGHNDRQTDVCG